MNPLLSVLITFCIFTLAAALPPLPLTQRNIPIAAAPQPAAAEVTVSSSSSSTPTVTCSTSSASPGILALHSALVLFNASCNPSVPLTVARSKACINLITTATVTIDLCGWDAEIACAGAENAVQSVLDQCASVGRGTAAGEVDTGEGVVRVQRVVSVG